MSKAIDILSDLIDWCMMGNFPKKPGAIIERLSKDKREELSKLTSDEVQNMRPPDYYDN